MAVQDKDYQQAYNYLSFATSGKITTYDDWLSSMALPQTSNQTAWEATLGKTTQNGDYATTEITIDILRPGRIFGGSQYSQQITYQLTKTGNSWLITFPTYLYWIY
jgi:hypothetical protein